MAATNEHSYTSDEMVSTYQSLSQSSMRELCSGFVAEHICQVHKIIQEKMGYTPFPETFWQSWDNLRLEKPKTHSDVKVAVPKTITDPEDPKGKKKIKTKETVDVEKRLRKVVTFNASGKSALAFCAVYLTHEAVISKDEIQKSDAVSIKSTISDYASDNCEYSLSGLIYGMCDKYDDAVIKEMFPNINGQLQTKLDSAIDKYITDTNIRNIVSGAFIKFLKIYTIHLASCAWFETKESEDDKTKERSYTGIGKTVSDKQLLQLLMSSNNLFLITRDKADGQVFEGVRDFYDAICISDEKKKEANKKAKAERDAKKSTEDKDKKKDALEVTKESPPNTDDEGSDNENESEPEDVDEKPPAKPKKGKDEKPEKKKVEKPEKEKKVDSPKAPALKEAPPANDRRRRGPPK